MAAKLTKLTHKIAIQLHLVAEICTICSSRARRPVRKLLDTPSYIPVCMCRGEGLEIWVLEHISHGSVAKKMMETLFCRVTQIKTPLPPPHYFKIITHKPVRFVVPLFCIMAPLGRTFENVWGIVHCL
jgi:hypothetical protein